MECVAIPGFHVRACFFSSIRAYMHHPSTSNFLEFLVSMKGVRIERERKKNKSIFRIPCTVAMSAIRGLTPPHNRVRDKTQPLPHRPQVVLIFLPPLEPSQGFWNGSFLDCGACYQTRIAILRSRTGGVHEEEEEERRRSRRRRKKKKNSRSRNERTKSRDVSNHGLE